MTKTDNFYNSLDLSSFEEGSAYRHYDWDRRIFGPGMFTPSISRDAFYNFFRLLCTSFTLPCPSFEKINQRNRAVTLILDNTIEVGEAVLNPYVVIHEFVHWYAWHKFKIYVTHNRPWAKKFERRLVWKTKKYWEVLK